MADTASPAPVAVPATPTKKGKSTPKKATKAKKHVSSHPKVSDMVNSAILTLKERGGSSLIAIKKYIAGHYNADVEKLNPFIKKYIKSAVANGTLIQTKGTGASGSFKLGAKKEKKASEKPKTTKKKPTEEKKKTAAKPKKTSPKKAAKATKKTAKASPKKPKSVKKPKSPKKAKTPKKEKKAKSPKKLKSPKPKKAAAKKPAKK